MGAVDGAFAEVMYPAYSLIQDDISRLKNAVSHALQLNMFVVLPLMYCMCAMSENVTLILLSDKWIDSVPFMQLSCIICSFWPLATISHATNAIGKSSVTFRINLISKSLILFFIIICIPLGVFAIMVGSLVATLIMPFISTRYYKKLIGYGVTDIFRDIRISMMNAIVSAIVVYLLKYLGLNIYVTTGLQFIAGVLVYWTMSVLTQNPAYISMLDVLKNRFVKK